MSVSEVTTSRPALRPAQIIELSPSVTHIQGATWDCNCIVIKKGRSAIVGDATWNPLDVETIREFFDGHDTHILITHGDIDHVSTIGACPQATVVASQATAQRVASGSAGEDLAREAGRWGMEFLGEPRVDRIVEPGERVKLGEWHVTTVETAGHAVDGLAYVIEEEGLFLVGDYLMASQHPMTWWSFREGRRSTERLVRTLDTLERVDLEWVVPGHGRVLSVPEARTVGEQDLAYMEEVERVSDEALREGVSSREWLLAVYDVPVPRPCTPDIEMLCPRLINIAAIFRDRDYGGHLPWQMDMA